MAEINDKESNLVDITIGDKKYKVEIADTPEKQEKGLMGRESLPENQGMLFIYDEPQDLSYWMKNTLISLDIIFIDDDMEVVSVKQGQPMSEEPITEDDVQYVLEVIVIQVLKKEISQQQKILMIKNILCTFFSLTDPLK